MENSKIFVYQEPKSFKYGTWDEKPLEQCMDIVRERFNAGYMIGLNDIPIILGAKEYTSFEEFQHDYAFLSLVIVEYLNHLSENESNS